LSSAAEQLKQLGRYDLTRVLGKGAMGIVYEGLDPRLNRKVAIKTILKGHMDDEDAAKEYSMRFMREAQSVARLNHAHIVQVYDFGEQGEIAYIVMEFIKGKELKNFFDANERFELKEAVRIMCELLDALEMAHENGIVHRDIKPANVMLDGQARVKLADFGVARVTDDRSAAEKTQAGTMVGTPAYMSPEQTPAAASIGTHIFRRDSTNSLPARSRSPARARGRSPRRSSGTIRRSRPRSTTPSRRCSTTSSTRRCRSRSRRATRRRRSLPRAQRAGRQVRGR
jgi:serine/threonine protein kinase